ncbi:hypothetical protein MKJ01_05615 [Chryseobacterium sp. SSA4.19]|uniref:hypothetical protein n=1 Tax=Chryseobacterium sp. SSA4.19 TaxID=2919915 RepID=UPI001F4EDA90|nr:hypothetical protein [Chryseobacterium sp. SSA4.19]MCJ8153238.1 hypothetical protein [Chryseobacterium sp. SSA4.19]
MKLKPMMDFVLEQKQKTTSETDYAKPLKLIFNYANFLKQPLTLGMFVPCDENGNVLEKPENFIEGYDSEYNEEIYNYMRVKEKVLFKGFSHGKFGFKDQYYVKLGENMKAVFPFPNIRNYTIEDLIEFEPELTPSALKLIGLNS